MKSNTTVAKSRHAKWSIMNQVLNIVRTTKLNAPIVNEAACMKTYVFPIN